MKANVRERKRKNETVYEYYFTYKGQRYSKSGYKTAKKAEKAGSLVLAELMVKSPPNMAGENKPLQQLIDEFLEVVKLKYSEATIYLWTVSFRHVDAAILRMPIKDIGYNTIQTFFNNRSKDAYRFNDHIRWALTRVFDYAVRMKYINDNPTRDVMIFGNITKRKRTYITHEQFNIIIDEISNNRRLSDIKKGSLIMAIKLGYYLGLRFGEMATLEKKDFNLNNKTVVINKTLVYAGLKQKDLYAKNGGKTEASNATLFVPDNLVEELKEWFKVNPFDIVCPEYNGGYLSPSPFGVYFEKRSQSIYGFNFNYHMLRHSFAQRLVNNQIDTKTAQELMRHTSFNTTMQYYVHSSNEQKIEAVNMISR